MKRWTISELESTDILTFALCMMLDRQSKLKPWTPLYNMLDAACKTVEELRDICRKNEHYASGFITIEEAIFQKVRRDKLITNLECHMENDSNSSYDFLLGHDLTAEAVMNDTEMLNHIVTLFFKVDGESDYWTVLDTVIAQGVEDILERRKPKNCANCGGTSDVIFTADEKPCCKHCIENISSKCDICDRETLKGTTEVCSYSEYPKNVCFKCLDAYYTYLPAIGEYIHNDIPSVLVIS